MWHWTSLATLALALLPLAGGPTGGGGDLDDTTRLDLAATALLAGDNVEARRLLDALPEGVKTRVHADSENGQERERAGRMALQYALARAMLEPWREDPFELVTAVASASDWSADAGDPLTSTAWQRLFARYADREGYGRVAAFVLREVLRTRDYTETSKYSSKEEKARAADGKDDLVRDLARLETPPPAETREGATVEDADAIAATVARLLAEPRLVPVLETTLPRRIRRYRPDTREPGRSDQTADDTEVEDASAQRPAGPAGASLPKGFDTVRFERRGDEAVVIAASQDFDPVGEISRGAYWVLRSHDGGRTWGAPLYTGLRISEPYIIHPSSNLPMLAGDHLAVEASIRELDESSITFPPVGLRTKRSKDGVVLIMNFDVLERDTDADGLTDLAEERLITDPRNPDTDGDGLGDAGDPLPQVPWSGTMNQTSAALAAVLEAIAGMRSMAIIHEIGPEPVRTGELLAQARRATLTDQRTTFIVGSRPDFRALLPSQRVIVLTNTEMEAAIGKFGQHFPIRLSLFVLDHEEQCGYVIWSASWVGGSLSLKKEDGVWSVTTVSSWIT
jgi:hypothetical protein